VFAAWEMAMPAAMNPIEHRSGMHLTGFAWPLFKRAKNREDVS
jgi:hypothetical protein